MRGTSVEVRGLSKRFADVQAVDDISFEVYSGECFGLLGPNGAGKSTTIKMMIALLPADEGEVVIAGHPLSSEPMKVKESIGYVPQMLSVDGVLTGYENLLIFAKLYGLGKEVREQRIREILKLLGLEEAAHRQVKTYSGGMIRRLEIGQAILHRPKVLFLDEPTVGLDPVARKAVWEHLETLREHYNMTVLLTTHYMEEAEALCARIAIMNQGSIAALGTIQELRDEMGSPDASVDDIFAYFAGNAESQRGGIRDVTRSRRTAKRLG